MWWWKKPVNLQSDVTNWVSPKPACYPALYCCLGRAAAALQLFMRTLMILFNDPYWSDSRLYTFSSLGTNRARIVNVLKNGLWGREGGLLGISQCRHSSRATIEVILMKFSDRIFFAAKTIILFKLELIRGPFIIWSPTSQFCSFLGRKCGLDSRSKCQVQRLDFA